MNRLPADWTICEPWVHPRTGEPIVVVAVGRGIPLAWHLDGSIGAITWDWRAYPPDPCGLAAARALADHLRASQVRPGEAL